MDGNFQYKGNFWKRENLVIEGDRGGRGGFLAWKDHIWRGKRRKDKNEGKNFRGRKNWNESRGEVCRVRKI